MMTQYIKDIKLAGIEEKVLAGVPVSEDDAHDMLSTHDIAGLGFIAAQVKESLHHKNAYYGVNVTLNYTNICELRCPLCAFSRDAGDVSAYSMSIDQVREKVLCAAAAGIDEVHIVGGLNPALKFDYYLSLVRTIKEVNPLLHVVAFTAVEIDYFARKTGISVKDVLCSLKKAGLDTIPGGGAEIFAPGVRKIISPKKISAERWLEVHQTAHENGIRSNATMLFNHFETKEDIVGHLSLLRTLQSSTGGFKAFVPLVFHRENTGLCSGRGVLTGFDTIRLFAAARIFLHNFSHIKAHWMYVGEQCAEMLLSFGADDIGATYFDEKIVHAAGAETASSGSEPALRRMIERADCCPKRTNASYYAMSY